MDKKAYLSWQVRIMVTLTFDEEEMLEALWTNLVESDRNNCLLDELKLGKDQEEFDVQAAVVSLVKNKLIKLSNDKKEVSMTPIGQELAIKVIRRHRLSERLFKDILQVRNHEMEGASCRFEHLLTPGIEKNVCTLLGHPTYCPHGRPIPPGPCCREHRFQVESAILPLSHIPEGTQAKVAYISTNKIKRLNRLLSFGLLPGTEIKLEKKSPALILKLDETVLALEKAVAEDLFCRRAGGE